MLIRRSRVFGVINPSENRGDIPREQETTIDSNVDCWSYRVGECDVRVAAEQGSCSIKFRDVKEDG